LYVQPKSGTAGSTPDEGYVNATWEGVVFREQLDELRGRLALDVVHVLRRPDPAWSGERGDVDGDLLARRLPADLRGAEIFVCGGAGMAHAAVRALAVVGAAAHRVHVEHFTRI